MDKIKKDWEFELGKVIEDGIWEDALRRVNNSSSCARLNLIQLKVVHRIYFTNFKLSKIYPNVTDSCNRCHMSPAHMTHMFWSCPRLQGYWTTIFKHLSEAWNIEISPCAEMALFGVSVSPIRQPFSKGTKQCLAFASLLARRRILLEWKSSVAPKASVWLKDLMMYLNLEKIKFNLRGLPDRFDQMWGPMIEYLTRLKTLQLPAPTG